MIAEKKSKPDRQQVDPLGFLGLDPDSAALNADGMTRKEMIKALLLPARSVEASGIERRPGLDVDSKPSKNERSRSVSTNQIQLKQQVEFQHGSVKDQSDGFRKPTNELPTVSPQVVSLNGKRKSLTSTVDNKSELIVAEWPFCTIATPARKSEDWTSIVRPSGNDLVVAGDWMRREIEFLQTIQNPHVLKILASDWDTGKVFVEQVETTVAARIQGNGSQSPAFSRQLLTAGLNGLREYHQQGRLHAELDIDRLLIGSDGVIKLAGSPGFKPHGEMRPPQNKNRCIAPELLTSSSFGRITFAADIYCLGHAVLQTLLGSRYFEAIKSHTSLRENQFSIAQWHGSEVDHFPSLAELLPELPDLYPVLEKMIQKQVSERYFGTEAVLEDLERCIHVTTTRNQASTKKTAKKIAKPIVTSSRSHRENEAGSNANPANDIQGASRRSRVLWFVALTAAFALVSAVLWGATYALNKELTTDQNPDTAPPIQNPQQAQVDGIASTSLEGKSIDARKNNEIESFSVDQPRDAKTSPRVESFSDSNELVPKTVAQHVVESNEAGDYPSDSELPVKPFFSNLFDKFPADLAPADLRAEMRKDPDSLAIKPTTISETAERSESEKEVAYADTPIATNISPELTIPSFQLNRNYPVLVSPAVESEYRQLVGQIHSLLTNEARDSDLVKKVGRLYMKANRLVPDDFRLDLMISFGFEFHKKRVEADRAIALGMKKLQRTKTLQGNNFLRSSVCDLDLALKPLLQQIRLKIRDTSTRNLNRVVSDCFNLILELQSAFEITNDVEAAQTVARFVACVIQQIKMENEESRYTKVANVQDYGNQIAELLHSIDPAIERAFRDCQLALQENPKTERLAFLKSLNYLVEMDSILRSYHFED